MSPRPTSGPASVRAARTALRLSALVGASIHEERIRRDLSLRQLADRAGLSASRVLEVETGGSAGLELYARLAEALGLRLEFEMVDPRRRSHHDPRQTDLVHASMGELEARRLRALGASVAIDEPYQHFQFAGRADVLAWDVGARRLLHLENRTRFPDLQAAFGSYNAKRMPARSARRPAGRSWRLGFSHARARRAVVRGGDPCPQEARRELRRRLSG